MLKIKAFVFRKIQGPDLVKFNLKIRDEFAKIFNIPEEDIEVKFQCDEEHGPATGYYIGAKVTVKSTGDVIYVLKNDDADHVNNFKKKMMDNCKPLNSSTFSNRFTNSYDSANLHLLYNTGSPNSKTFVRPEACIKAYKIISKYFHEHYDKEMPILQSMIVKKDSMTEAEKKNADFIERQLVVYNEYIKRLDKRISVLEQIISLSK